MNPTIKPASFFTTNYSYAEPESRVALRGRLSVEIV